MQIKASLQRLQAIVEGQDVANLVLLLKELVPDYNPGTELLKTALSIKPYNAGPEKIPVRREQTETPDAAKLTPLCANMSETGSPSTITVGRGKKSHFDKHEQDKLFFRCVGSFGA